MVDFQEYIYGSIIWLIFKNIYMEVMDTLEKNMYGSIIWWANKIQEDYIPFFNPNEPY